MRLYIFNNKDRALTESMRVLNLTAKLGIPILSKYPPETAREAAKTTHQMQMKISHSEKRGAKKINITCRKFYN